MEMPYFLNLGLPLLVAFVLSVVFLPLNIRYSILKGWVDVPNTRKVHVNMIPRTGGLVLLPSIGVAMFATGQADPGLMSYGFLAGLVILYITGLIDDLKGMSALQKLGFQVLAASILAASGWRIGSLPGVYGCESLSLVTQYGLTILLVTAAINAYNLIDGIDGLAAGLAVVIGSVFCWMFFEAGDAVGMVIAAAMAGAYAAFLIFNFAPARVFMGDTGSMGLGFLLAALAIRMMWHGEESAVSFQSWQIMALLSTPMYDVVRVMTDRAIRHGKLFRAERNHLHHLVIEHGISHRVAMVLIILTNGLAIGFAILGQDLQWYIGLPVLTSTFLISVAIFRNLGWYSAQREAADLLQQLHPLSSDNPFYDDPVIPSKSQSI